ncbi:MAG: M64 family metallopeptidase [Mycobacterium sp.]
MADSVTVLQDVGTSGGKKTLAILGDGFAAGADQTTYNNYVRDEVMRGVFLSDAFNEDSASWNIRRVNLESANSGASTRTWNLMGTPKNLADDTFTENIVDTALDIISNGEWWHNWFETASTTQASIDAALTKWAPGADFVLIVVNSTLPGGLRTGTVLKVTTQESAAVIAHEFGHGFGDLADEYSATGKGNFTAGEPSKVNVTKETDRTKIKWRQYIDPNTPIPTGTGANSGYTAGVKPAGWDDQDDCGLFEGAHTWETGIYRPALNCRMRHNANAFCPPCYSEMKAKHQTASGRTFNTVVAGRFTGSTRSEFFGIDPRGISLYRADGTRWQHVRTTAGIIPGGWGIRPGDTYVAGDFDGDGRDELVVYNSTWWTIPLLGLIKVATDGSLQLIRRFDADIPGWGGFATNDRFLVGDFNGDGRDDLLVTNFTDWVMPYVATLQSTGSGFTLTRRYDGDIPGWGGMRVHDEIYLGDFAGTGRSDLLIWNSRDWSSNYLGLFRQLQGGFQCIRFYEDDLPGWGGFARNDRFYVGDFSGDGKDDLFIFNGPDWANPYLGMFRSTGSDFSPVQLYDGDVPGWGGLAEHDQFLPADLTGSGRVGLFAWNMEDWGPNYAGRMVSSGSALTADWREDWVGEWHLGSSDAFSVAKSLARRIVVDREMQFRELARRTGGHWDTLGLRGVNAETVGRIERVRLWDLGVLIFGWGPERVISHNRDWLGTMRTAVPLTLDCIYNRWIHNYKYGRNW